MYIHIYIERGGEKGERESEMGRERERHKDTYIYIYRERWGER